MLSIDVSGITAKSMFCTRNKFCVYSCWQIIAHREMFLLIIRLLFCFTIVLDWCVSNILISMRVSNNNRWLWLSNDKFCYWITSIKPLMAQIDRNSNHTNRATCYLNGHFIIQCSPKRSVARMSCYRALCVRILTACTTDYAYAFCNYWFGIRLSSSL